jgi:ethanolamine ammonia-lyase small subunit
MKDLILAIAVAFSMAFGSAYATEAAKPEVKKVCIDKLTKDGKPVLDKAGKPVQTCKEMKIHKKLEGTQVPEKK